MVGEGCLDAGLSWCLVYTDTVCTDPRIPDIYLMDTFWSFLGLFIIKINKDSVFTSTTDLL